MRDFHTVYLGLGTNLGDRAANLQKARDELDTLQPEIHLLRSSRLYETEPWGYADQPAFLNQVIEIGTTLQPRELLETCKRIEAEMGREPTFRYGPRCIDLDILFFDDWVVEEPGLNIPHKRMPERAFVLAPLAELEPGLRHPTLLLTVHQLLQAVDQSGVRPWTAE